MLKSNGQRPGNCETNVGQEKGNTNVYFSTNANKKNSYRLVNTTQERVSWRRARETIKKTN